MAKIKERDIKDVISTIGIFSEDDDGSTTFSLEESVLVKKMRTRHMISAEDAINIIVYAVESGRVRKDKRDDQTVYIVNSDDIPPLVMARRIGERIKHAPKKPDVFNGSD